MSTAKGKFQTVDEYISTFPKDVQDTLEKIRQAIKEAAPDVTEAISYGMPAFNLDNRYLVYFAAWKNHIGMYPIPAGDEAFQKELAPYKGAKSSVRFPMGKPIPYGLIKKIVKYRAEENRERERKK